MLWNRTLNRDVSDYVADHMRGNAAIRAARPTRLHRVLRAILSRPIALPLALYALIDVAAVALETLVARGYVPILIEIPAVEANAVLSSSPGVAITAQAGVLAVITLSLALIAVVAQRNEANADVQIYYHHSMAFEIATSCLALIAVLSVQSAWPLQVAAHALFGTPDDPSSKLALTFLNLAWLALNVAGVGHFVTVTLQFVQRSSRERMRKQYVVAQILADDLRGRLRGKFLREMVASLAASPEAVAGGAASVRPAPLFRPDRDGAELTLRFRQPRTLTNVWFLPLQLAMRSWRSRTDQASASARKDAPPSPDGPALTLLLAPGETARDGLVVCRRRGGLPMNLPERLAIRLALRFSKQQDAKDLPSPGQLLEEQVERVLERLRSRAPVGFDAELLELVRFHRFLLATGSSGEGHPSDLNLSEISDSIWHTPHAKWIGEYRRIFDAASDLIGSDEQYLASAAEIVPRLLVEETGVVLTDGIVIDILRLGAMLMHSVEEWAVRHAPYNSLPNALGPVRLPVAGGDRRALELALRDVVGAWESVLVDRSFGGFGTPNADKSARWDDLRARWPRLKEHLFRTAYCLALAVWYDDEEGARLFRRALAGWSSRLLSQLDRSPPLRFPRLVLPDLLAMSWEAAFGKIEPLTDPAWPVDPDSLFARLVDRVHKDVILLTTELLVFWNASGRTKSDLGPRTARGLLNLEDLDKEGGAPSPSRTLAQNCYDLLRLHAAGERHVQTSYGHMLDGLLQQMEMVTSDPRVPKRTFGSRAVDSRLDLASIEAALLATSRTPGPELAAGMEELADASLGVLGGDPLLRDIERTIRGWLDGIRNRGAQFDRAVELLHGASVESAEVASARLAAAEEVISRIRARRLAAAPVDGERLERFRFVAETTLRAGRMDLDLFRASRVMVGARSESARDATFTLEHVRKGHLVEPEMEYPIANFDGLVEGAVTKGLRGHLHLEFFSRPTTTYQTAPWLSEAAFWHQVRRLAGSFAGGASLLIPYSEFRLLSPIRFLSGGTLHGLTLAHGRGGRADVEAFRCTVEGVAVLSADLPPGTAILFDTNILRSLSFEPIDGERLVDADFRTDAGEPLTGCMEFRVRLAAEWSEEPMFELRRKEKTPPTEPPDVSVRTRILHGLRALMRHVSFTSG